MAKTNQWAVEFVEDKILRYQKIDDEIKTLTESRDLIEIRAVDGYGYAAKHLSDGILELLKIRRQIILDLARAIVYKE